MSQVNYVQQVNLFMEYARRNRLTSHERVFFFALFHVANTWAQRAVNHEWPDVFFQVSNSEIHEWSDLEERAIRSTRNTLKQRGLIDFRKGDGRRSDPEYKINYLQLIGYKIVPVDVGDSTGNGGKIAPDAVPDHVGDHVGDRVPDAVPDPVGETQDFATNGGKIAPDAVPDAFIPCTPFSNNNTLNAKRERAKAALRAGTGTRKDESRPREGGFGLVDLDGGGLSGFEGLVPLPWEEGRR